MLKQKNFWDAKHIMTVVIENPLQMCCLEQQKKKQGGITTRWKMLEYEKYVYDT